MTQYRHCATCDATMHQIIWTAHIRSKQHRDAIRETEVTPLKMARVLLILSAAFVVFGWISYVLGGDAWPFVYVTVATLIGALIVGKR